MAGLRKVTPEELREILEAHRNWISSGGKWENRADLRRADLCGAKLSGANLHEANLCGAKLSDADLSRAHLSRADLRGADLRKTNLRMANLSGADLSGANLRGADLRGANLRGANLRGADLRRADLRGAKLSEADLSRAPLSWADLSGADLRWANFWGAYIDETDFKKCSCGGTIFADVDLSKAKNLTGIIHRGPSTVGLDTLVKSKGNIPKSFLRGCGVPQLLIDYALDAAGSLEGIQYFHCFISHASEDKPFVRRLRDKLALAGVPIWLDEKEMLPGKKLREQIHLGISEADKLMIVLSEASMKSEWVKEEIYKARERERAEKIEMLFPISLIPYNEIEKMDIFDGREGKDLARLIQEYYIPNYSDEAGLEAGFEKLLAGLRRSAEPKKE